MNKVKDIIWLFRQIKDSAEKEVGRAKNYIFLVFSGGVFFVINLVIFFPIFFFLNEALTGARIIHTLRCLKLSKEATVLSGKNLLLVIKRTPGLLKSIKEKNQGKIKELLENTEDEKADGHGFVRTSFFILFFSYLLLIFLIYSNFQGINIPWQ